MSDDIPSRTCGSCGANVEPADLTCPSCGALLAAYEAPAGSDTPGDMSSPEASEPVAIVNPSDVSAVPVITLSLDVPADPDTSPTEEEPIAEPVPFDAAAALEESRRMLGMSLTPPYNIRRRAAEDETGTMGDIPLPIMSSEPEDPSIQVRPTPEPQPQPQPQEETLLVTPRRTPPEPTAPEPSPVPGTGTMPTRNTAYLAEAAPRDIPRRPPLTQSSIGGGSAERRWEPTMAPSNPAPVRPDSAKLLRIGAAIPILLVVCWMLVMLDFSNIFTLAVVVFILFNLIKYAAGFSGRKTTTMSPPDSPDRWQR